MTTELFDSLAAILTYPTDEYKHHVGEFIRRLKQDCPDDDVTLVRLVAFNTAIENLSLGELEELYTRTFDINPVSSLEVGWHLYGETYERGAFLVTMRDVLRCCNIEESSELPDHLTHVLLAVGRMNEEEAAEFVSHRLLKALDKMLEGFAEKENPYEHVLQSIKLLVSHHATSSVGASHD